MSVRGGLWRAWLPVGVERGSLLVSVLAVGECDSRLVSVASC